MTPAFVITTYREETKHKDDRGLQPSVMLQLSSAPKLAQKRKRLTTPQAMGKNMSMRFMYEYVAMLMKLVFQAGGGASL